MKNKIDRQNESLRIAEVLNQFDQGLEELTGKISEMFSNKIIMGYDFSSYRFKKESIEKSILAFNEIIGCYVKLFKGKKPSRQTLDEICKLDFKNAEKFSVDLKLQYMKRNNVQIPNFPNYKPEKLLEAYIFPGEAEELINSICELRAEIRHLAEFHHYFNEESGLFYFTKEDDKALLKDHTVFASVEQINEIIALHLMCIGLTNLKRSDYSFKELPEIDHRLMKMIKIEKDKHGVRETGIAVNIDWINNPYDDAGRGINSPYMTRKSISQEPKGMSIRVVKGSSTPD